MRSKLVGSTRLKTGEPVELYKAKGMSRGQFNFDDYIAMFDEKNPKPLEQEQTQFRLPRALRILHGRGHQAHHNATSSKTSACTVHQGACAGRWDHPAVRALKMRLYDGQEIISSGV